MRAVWLMLAAILASQSAGAQTRSVSHTVWVISGDQVTVRVVFPAVEARRMAAPGLPQPSNDALAAYLLDHLGVEAAGSSCEAIDQGYDIGRVNALAVGTGLYGFEIIFHCTRSTRPILKDALLFDRTPQHIDYARIETEGLTLSQLFTAKRQTIDLGLSLESAGPSAYASLGASHIVHSEQRLCFLLGLLLLTRTRRDWLVAAAGLSCGYVASVLIVATDWVPQMPSLESSIGLLVAVCAAQWVAEQNREPHRLALGLGFALLLLSVIVGRFSGTSAWTLLGAAIFCSGCLVFSARRPTVAVFVLPLLFAGLDGVVLQGDYTRLHLWRVLGSPTLLFFNVGALLTELGIMTALYAASLWWARSRRRTAFDPVAAEVAATALAGLGAFWMLIQLKG
jgi:hypothetical protein